MVTLLWNSGLYISIVCVFVSNLSPVLCHVDEFDEEWWKKAIIYQIYPRSYQDSDGDGVGDLTGIRSRLDYLDYLGVDAIWLSPIYQSPMVDFGYDISNHTAIDPIFGTLQDFDLLIEAVHLRGLKLIMDFIPNHTSDQHPWFMASKSEPDGPYSNYYRWHPGRQGEDGQRIPPNNWLSVFGGSAWTWDGWRQAYYLHQFTPEQPDLDFRNPLVRQKMQDVLRFWLDRGVDGFRIDAIGTLFEVEDILQDEPQSFKSGATPKEHDYLSHVYTMDQGEIHDVVREWRNIFNQYEDNTDKHIFMIMEIYDETLKETMKYYDSGADIPFNFELMNINTNCGGRCFHGMIDKWMTAMPKDKWPNFVVGNHDQKRITTKKGALYANAINIMLLTLPGTPTTYYGEEIGMLDIEVSYEDTQDPWGKRLGKELYMKYSRDPCRAPMQWDGQINSGFSTAKVTWLPVHPDYETHNVEIQRNDSSGQSSLLLYREAAQLRRRRAFMNNHMIHHVTNDHVFSFVRYDSFSAEAYLTAINVGNEISVDDYAITIDNVPITEGEVVISTGHISETLEQTGDKISLKQIALHPGDALVILLEFKTTPYYRDEL